jgi:ATP-binding cassette, subfamily B, bacterial
MSFQVYRQLDAKDCGPSCLRMVAKHFGKSYSLATMRDKCGMNRDGVNLLGLSVAAESIGLETLGAKLNFEQLSTAQLPCIVFWQKNHFVVLYRLSRRKAFIADPAHGLMVYPRKEFIENWTLPGSNGEIHGFTLLLEPSESFYKEEGDEVMKQGFSSVLYNFFTQKKLILQLVGTILLASVLQISLPFLTQSIVDKGINYRNINLIVLILIAQIVLFLSRATVEIVRTWILTHITSRVNVTIVSGFLSKLIRLPLSFFDTKKLGDILQRVNDQSRIEQFLTGTSSYALFAVINLIVFSVVLINYNFLIFFIYMLGSALYLFWVTLFVHNKRILDIQHFKLSTRNQDSILQIVNGIQEIKINNCERPMRWEWEKLQARLFKLNLKRLALSHYQMSGASVINEFKNILITFLAATAVVENKITLGAMLAIQYIIGQLNGPIDRMSQFIVSYNDARLSVERLTEIQSLKDEEPTGANVTRHIPVEGDIEFKDVTFSYPGARRAPVLKNINLVIPSGKMTAIVGMSGSGKTTLLKLLLKFYNPQKGEITIKGESFKQLGQRGWRDLCGVVMQDGYIFADTIARNISLGDSNIDSERLIRAATIANIHDYIAELPMGYNTILGADGVGLSQGQRQRILIARSVYKAPRIILFDEATNALDATNESTILNSMQSIFEGKTAVIIAHRLSTVRNADKIVVMQKGEIVEEGAHHELLRHRKWYYNLVKDQLELAG